MNPTGRTAVALEQAGYLLHRPLLSKQDKQKEHEGSRALMLCLADFALTPLMDEVGGAQGSAGRAAA
jgi:hypothetical protein